jgi:hypothetical protein
MSAAELWLERTLGAGAMNRVNSLAQVRQLQLHPALVALASASGGHELERMP